MSIGRNVAILLFDNKITQKELAKVAGVSEMTISKLIRFDKMVSVPKLVKIANRLGVTVDELLK